MQSEAFATALLQPAAPVPKGVKGRAEKRFAVYRNNVVVGLVQALESNFPALRSLLGDTYFAGLAREFALAHPPTSALMFEYGEALPTYLEAQAELARYPYLADVARLESLMRESHHAPDADALAAERLSHVAEDDFASIVFKGHPAARIMASSFAVASITLANRNGTSLTTSAANPEYALVTRPALHVELTAITPANGLFLQALLAGKPLGDAADETYGQFPDFDMAAALGAGLAHGLFTSFTLETDS